MLLTCDYAILQDELARVLYPMFIHCYLELISKRATSEAHQLLTKQKQRFISTGATTSKIRQQVCLAKHQQSKGGLTLYMCYVEPATVQESSHCIH